MAPDVMLLVCQKMYGAIWSEIVKRGCRSQAGLVPAGGGRIVRLRVKLLLVWIFSSQICNHDRCFVLEGRKAPMSHTALDRGRIFSENGDVVFALKKHKNFTVGA